MSAERIAELERLLHASESANAELTEQLSGMQRQLRRAGQAETALRNQLARTRDEEPDSPTVKKLLRLWRDLHRDGDNRVKIDLTGDRGSLMKKAVKKYGEQRVENAIRGALLDDWAMGRNPKIRAQGKRFNDVKHILKDDATIEEFERQFLTAASPTVTAVDVFLAELEDVRQVAAGQWTAKCPAHEDRHASLSVAQGAKGCVAHCHAGCSIDEITRAAGVGLESLFDPEDAPALAIAKALFAPAPGATPDRLPSPLELASMQGRALASPKFLARVHELKKWTPETLKKLGVGFDGERVVFPVYDHAAELVNLVRYWPGPHPRGPKSLAVKGRRRDLFPTPASIDGDEIWIVEGEPDAVSAHELGLPGVALPGTNGWRDEYTRRFAGRDVVVCLDCDEQGRTAAGRIALALSDVAKRVRIVDLDPNETGGYDLTDVLVEGGTAAVLRALAEDAGAVIRIGERAA